MNIEHSLKTRRAQSKAGSMLGKLRLGKTHLLVEDGLKLGVQYYTDEPTLSNEDAEPRGMLFARRSQENDGNPGQEVWFL